MKLSLPILSAALVASSFSSANAWSSGRGPSSLFISPTGRLMFDSILSPTDGMRMRHQKMRRNLENQLTRISPRYELRDTEHEISVSLDVPGVKLEDIEVTLEDDGKVLAIKGHREKKNNEGGSFTSRFSQSFSLDPTVDPEKFTAKLDNGVLVVSAPKDMQRIEQNIRRIPIVQETVEAKDNTAKSTPSDEDGATDEAGGREELKSISHELESIPEEEENSETK